ncbi:MAG: alpha/beta hydrolase [Eubacteriales bacterium]|nr:alpha/beta hydrolase [Eubacteriales bacterium]
MQKYKSDVYKSEAGKALLQDLYRRQLQTIPVPYQECTVNTRFGSTHIVTYGNPMGLPVLGFHGGNATNPYSLRTFVKHVDMSKIRFIVPDTIGNIGFSAEKRLSSANADYGKWACDILDALGLDTVPVFGGSYGGGIAIRLATYAPERIERLMLIIPSGIANANLFKMAKLALPTVGYMLRPTSDEKLKRAVSSMSPSFNDDFIEMMKLSILHGKFEMVMPRNATKKELYRLTAPVYIMAEQFDCLFPGQAVLKRAAEIFPNLVGTELLSFGGHGAFLMDEQTHHALYDRITSFLIE